MSNKRDYREETQLNSAEFILLKHIAGKFGISKSAALRMCLHIVGDDLNRKEIMRETGIITED